MNQVPDVIMIAVITAITVGGSVWGLAWWLSSKFSSISHLVYEHTSKIEMVILSKLEYHEKHDDSRFDDIKRDLWEIKIRQAGGLSDIRDMEKILKSKKNDNLQQ